MSAVADMLRARGGQGLQMWALDDGAQINAEEVVLRVRGRFVEYAAHVSEITGNVAAASGWATAARALVTAAQPLPVILTTSQFVLPRALETFEYAAQVGNISVVSPLREGLLPRAWIVLMGDTLRAARAFAATLPRETPRLALVDTFHDAADEAVRVALGLGDQLTGVVVEAENAHAENLSDLAKRVRVQLDLAGFPRVKIFVCGEITAARIELWKQDLAPLDGFFVGETIARAAPLPFRAELKESDGKPLGRRGLTPGTTPNPRLKRVDVE